MDDTPDLTSLRRALQSRVAEKESAEMLYAREKASLADAQRYTIESLSLANDALSVRRKRIQDEEQELVKLSVTRSRQLAYKEEYIAKSETERKDLKATHAELDEDVRRLHAALAQGRQALSDVQQRADQHLQRIRSVDRDVTEAKRKMMSIDAQRLHDVTQHAQKREEMERSIRDLEAHNAVLEEKLNTVSVAAASDNAAHVVRFNERKKILAEMRDKFTWTRGQLQNVRDTLELLERDEEEAARRRRKLEEESTREFLASQTADRIQSAATMEDRVRLVHGEYDRQAGDLNSKLEQLNRSLIPLRDDAQSYFVEELRLDEVIRDKQDALLGTEEIKQRFIRNQERLQESTAFLDDITRDTQRCQQQHRDLTHEVSMVRDIVAPMNDVESAVLALRARSHDDRQALADVEAQGVIERVAIEGRIRAIMAENAKVTQSIDQTNQRKTEVVEDALERRRSMEGDLRVLTTEVEALEVKIVEWRQRNQLLDGSIEHNARQKKMLEEDLANRRELARRAAATLLAQLEQA